MKTFLRRYYYRIQQLIPDRVLKHKDFVKFAFVGGFGTLVNMGCLWILKSKFGFSLELAGIIAIEISILNNFVWNDLWTFRKRKNISSLFRRFVKYNLSVIIGVGINYTVLIVLSRVFGIYYLLSNLVGIGCAMMSNYFLSSRWAWKEK